MVRIVCLMLLTLLAGAAWADQPQPSQWGPEIAAFTAKDRQQPPPKEGVLFIGSSSIHAWTTLAQDFPGVPVINRGFGGSAIADSTYYADRIAVPYKPRVIVMYAGDNDMAEGAGPEQVLHDVQAFVALVRRALPHTAIVYISIKPSVARENLWPSMREANAKIAHWMHGREGLRFVDISAAMLDAQGRPRPELLREDGLHMTAAGYAIWVAELKPVLAAYGFPVHGG
ncbi:MAG TPA: SGNH/GDSL hydrolase family protein [Dyella sp.]|uniref:SGNH/GDSL hydrolase family protein n=1 Tax=Dyella sp. TaxID=1869338 RepID=UPI002F94FBCA